MHSTHHRPTADATLPACPDCATRPASAPGGVPRLAHDPTCPAGRSEDAQAVLDAAWLAAEPGGTRVRPLTLGEAGVLAAHLRPAQRRRAAVHVRQVGPGELLRTVVVSGRVVAVAASALPTVGAR